MPAFSAERPATALPPIDVELMHPDGRREPLRVPPDALIGKDRHADIRLGGWRVAREHARLLRTPGGVLVEDLGGLGGVQVNGQRIDTAHGPLAPSDVIELGGFTLRLHASPSPPAAPPAAPDPDQPPAVANGTGPQAASKTTQAADAARPTIPLPPTLPPTPVPGDPAAIAWRARLHQALLETMDLRRHDVSALSDEDLRAHAGRLLDDILTQEHSALPAGLDTTRLRQEVLDEAVGLGPLEALLGDDAITEIMVNRHDEVFVERAGRLERHPAVFTSDRAVLGVIERIVTPLGRRIDESSPMVDARLKDGSRVNAIIPPLAIKGPCLTIRKFARRQLHADDLVRLGALSPAMAQFLDLCVAARKNIVVAGGTGSGKTTLLNILSNAIPPGERIVTVEDAAELRLAHAHLVSLESRPSNAEGRGTVSIRDLVRNTLRMRPDRIVVGECRGPEALDMLQAMNTGHEGSLTTLHANTPRDALSRLETMVLMAGMDLPLAAIREQIASAVDILVQQTRFACGSRRVTAIVEVTGLESGTIQLQELFRHEVTGRDGASGRVQGRFVASGMVPSFFDGLREAGLPVDTHLFHSDSAEGYA